jgi:NADPH:quinone reductase-like Zn-dependent oxidoreductase
MTAHPTTGAAVDLLTKDLSTKDSATMRLWSMDALGRENLRQSTAPIPTPARGEILVKVAAVSLNFRDKLVIEGGMGLALTFPFVPGSDMAGTVVRAGEDVTRFRVGDRVISTFRPDWIDGPPSGTASVPPYETLGGTHPGVLADYVCFPEAWFSRTPDTLDDAQASTLPCAGLTAWFALVERSSLHPGQTLLVQGTGGVALFGLQIARAHGAEVIVLSGSEEKLARAKALGAAHLINRSREDWVQAVYRVTGDRGADHIFELAGGANLGRSVEAVAINGRISVIGVFEGFAFSGPMAPLLLKSPTIQGIGVGHRRALEDLVRAVDRIGLKPVIDHRYGFDELGAALDHLDRGPFGKIVVQMDA